MAPIISSQVCIIYDNNDKYARSQVVHEKFKFIKGFKNA